MASTKEEQNKYKKLIDFVEKEQVITVQAIKEGMGCTHTQARKYLLQLEKEGILGSNGPDRYEEVKRFVIWNNSVSIKKIQQKLKCGFRETCEYIHLLEKAKIISDSDGMTPQKILVKNRYRWLIKDYFEKRHARIKQDEENYQLVKNEIIKNKRPTIALIQKVMRISWVRASGYMKRLEREGIVSREKGDSTRDVLVN